MTHDQKALMDLLTDLAGRKHADRFCPFRGGSPRARAFQAGWRKAMQLAAQMARIPGLGHDSEAVDEVREELVP